ncbi:sugar transporter [Sphaerosporella brunnea]|uniref:Sugar transporter n=1 Tax=Sphaerosporella brunnea TaxID=1250544 RepID=A0A5J5EP57_9PEZI|nr:sugar transporter [Sphaerosporella brunnea]
MLLRPRADDVAGVDVVIPLSEARRAPGGAVSVGDSEKAPHEREDVWTLSALRAEIEGDEVESGENPVYDRKSKVVNRALLDMGMGKYQWQLFTLCGFGWFTDNLWLQGLAIILPAVQREFKVPDNKIGYTTTATFIGLLLGASFWGAAADIIGRRLAFNTTLGIAGIFGLAVAGAPNWVGVAALFSVLGLGVGGNLPVDGALFLEFLPANHGGLLTMLSVWWPLGQLVASLIAWGFLPNYSCSAEQAVCTKEGNMGWRYTILTLGALTIAMFIARFFLFHLYESPKYYLSKGLDREAVATVHGIAAKNGTKTWLTLEILEELGGGSSPSASTKDSAAADIDAILKSKLSRFSLHRLRQLFATRTLAWSTLLVWFCWATIGMGYPLFNAFLPMYLARSGANGTKPNSIVYRNYLITSLLGVPGSILAHITVETRHIGRKGTLAAATLLSGVFLYLFTVSTSDAYQLAFTSLESFFQNAMYGVLYAYTPEVFPAPCRGTATGVASLLNRIMGLLAPIIATNTFGLDPRIPVWIAGALILSAFLAMVALPIETRDRAKL